jgi:hypothetical protein
VADQRPLSERFPLDEWIEAVENLVTQMGYEDWCQFRRMQEDEKQPELTDVWIARRVADGRLMIDHVVRTKPNRGDLIEGHEWVQFVEAPF